MKRVLAALQLLALAGCATQAKFIQTMDGLLGKPEIVIVERYGPPDREWKANDGTKILQYTKGNQIVLPGPVMQTPVVSQTTGNVAIGQGLRQTTGQYASTTTTYATTQAPPFVIRESCTVNFTIDKEGVVRRWSASGNYCKSR